MRKSHPHTHTNTSTKTKMNINMNTNTMLLPALLGPVTSRFPKIPTRKCRATSSRLRVVCTERAEPSLTTSAAANRWWRHVPATTKAQRPTRRRSDLRLKLPWPMAPRQQIGGTARVRPCPCGNRPHWTLTGGVSRRLGAPCASGAKPQRVPLTRRAHPRPSGRETCAARGVGPAGATSSASARPQRASSHTPMRSTRKSWPDTCGAASPGVRRKAREAARPRREHREEARAVLRNEKVMIPFCGGELLRAARDRATSSAHTTESKTWRRNDNNDTDNNVDAFFEAMCGFAITKNGPQALIRGPSMHAYVMCQPPSGVQLGRCRKWSWGCGQLV